MKCKFLVAVAAVMVFCALILFDGAQEKQRNITQSKQFQLMRIAYETGDYTKAYDMGKQLKPAEDVYYLLALSSRMLKKTNESLDYFELVIDYNANRIAEPQFMLQYAETLIAAESYEDAIAICTRCFQLSQDAAYLAKIEAMYEYANQQVNV